MPESDPPGVQQANPAVHLGEEDGDRWEPCRRNDGNGSSDDGGMDEAVLINLAEPVQHRKGVQKSKVYASIRSDVVRLCFPDECEVLRGNALHAVPRIPSASRSRSGSLS